MADASGPWPSPAKLNLMLRIVGRRADGYHELQTVVQFLDICDWLSFSVTSSSQVQRVRGPQEVSLEDDLTVRAARLLQAESGSRQGVSIALDKRLPIGAGLGGGSSNAATALVVLNRLWGINLDENELCVLALRLGADVPVFVRGFAAWVEGIGERLRPLDLPEPWYVVLRPDCHVSTGKVFQDPELTRNSNRITIRDFVEGRDGNDCLATVLRRYPRVKRAYDHLARVARPRLTGTGACVFAAVSSRKEAVDLLEVLSDDVAGFVARGCNHSPLLRQLAR